MKAIETERDKIAGSMEALKRMLPAMIEIQHAMAEVHRASYNAHIEQGFT